MKKLLLVFTGIFAVAAASAQISFSDLRLDVGGSYTMYKGDFGQNNAGAKIRFSLPVNEKAAFGLGFTYGFPIKTASEVMLTGGSTVPSEFVYNFKTITLDGDYYFGGEKEEGMSVYASGRMGLVLVSMKEKIKGSIPSGQQPVNQLEPVSENGFTLGLSLGGQYAFGNAKLFADAGIVLPANQVNGAYVDNVIPSHFAFNLGLRFSLFGGSGY
ncbi:MAG: hypothetical protein ABW019_11860 [Chitinophagaceae bacterium]